ncbi:MAG: type II secretion system protein GspG [Pseudomonadota bacterium]|nr:type II secretion system protein GspG [Pseudomonadota bacterium]
MNTEFIKIILILLFFILLFSLGPHTNVIPKKSTSFVAINLNILMVALESFKSDIGRYPNTQEGLDVLIHPLENNPKWKGPYLNKRQIDFSGTGENKDPWGTEYIYQYPAQYGENIAYDLYSCGKNKINNLGKGDDISIWDTKEEHYKKEQNEKLQMDLTSRLKGYLLIIILITLLLLITYDFFMKK